jgi:transcriptional regulator with XRE-family HTH domain
VTTTVQLIRALRASGMRQADIARRAQIPQSRLSRWEAGAVPTGADDALRLKRLHDETFGTDRAPPIPAEEASDAA